ncbi:phage portal protein [Blastococcus sp. CCUG 61487]|uniref:phage portal protein n=1 Tax=Blastococcus sp. CCUG 61487 TaxID=1840703 RepID=UPI0010BFAF95|nr:phage portal protein [Blastococcus sp. CCUG 61487]
MPLDDVDTPGSPGWWLRRLAKQLHEDLPRLQMLHDRHAGDPPLPKGAENAKAAFQAFQRQARTNFEELICGVVTERQRPVGFRTAAEGDENGDAVAARIWAGNELDVQFKQVAEYARSMGRGYFMLDAPEDARKIPVITAEDPRNTITEHDVARPSRILAMLKRYHDPVSQQDVAVVFLPAGVDLGDGPTEWATAHRAVRSRKTTKSTRMAPVVPAAWDWDGDPIVLATKRVPGARVANPNGLAEFERHIPLLDRINHTILQRMVIITMQAFRQRAIKNLPKHYPDDYPVEDLRGKEIDYEGVFSADPAAIWMLPGLGDAAAEIWESGQLDLTPVLSAIKDDAQHLMSVTRTPFFFLSPEAANGSAEGATLQREGLVFKVEDRNTRDGAALALMMSIALELAGEANRAELGDMETLWAPVERHSLAAKADAAYKAKASGMSALTILTDVWQMSPRQAQRELDARVNDWLTAGGDDEEPLGDLPGPAGVATGG